MTIKLPKDVEDSIIAKVRGGLFPSVDAAMTEAACLLLEKWGQSRAGVGTPASDGELQRRLFEAGYQIHEVAQVTGHKDLNGLWRTYTKLKPESLHRRPGITLETVPTARGRAHAAHRASAQDRPREPGAEPSDSATPETSALATR